MSSEWYWNFAGRVLGPFDLDFLKKAFHGGIMPPKDFVLQRGAGEWKRAETVADLYSRGEASRFFYKGLNWVLGNSFYQAMRSFFRAVQARRSGMSQEEFEFQETTFLKQFQEMLDNPTDEIQIDHTKLILEYKELLKKFPDEERHGADSRFMQAYQSLLKKYPCQAEKFLAQLETAL